MLIRTFLQIVMQFYLFLLYNISILIKNEIDIL
jgi:hypothetical protein